MAEVSPKRLRTTLQRAGIDKSSTPAFLCAVSGGLDSMVLVHLFLTLGCPLRVIHIDHASHPESGQWAEWVRAQLEAVDIPAVLHRLADEPVTGSLEEYWRNARRARFQQELEAGEVLVTAHHQDDQAETLLLQLLRGAGPAGLQAMPLRSELPDGRVHLRPLLGHSRDELERYATSQGVVWLDDPSNVDERFARNFLRHSVIPRLTERWPGARSAIARSSELIAESVMLNDELAALDTNISSDGQRLDWSTLASLNRARQANAVRFWLQRCGVRLPSRRRLSEALRQWNEAADDRLPTLTLPEGAVQRYRSELVYAPALIEDPGEWSGTLGPCGSVTLPAGQGVLAWQEVALTDAGTSAPQCALASSCRIDGQPLVVRFRRGGEKLHRAAGFHQSLKHWLQDRGVPPLLRDRLPLVFSGEDLIAIADIWIDARYRLQKESLSDEKVYRLSWRRSTASQAK